MPLAHWVRMPDVWWQSYNSNAPLTTTSTGSTLYYPYVTNNTSTLSTTGSTWYWEADLSLEPQIDWERGRAPPPPPPRPRAPAQPIHPDAPGRALKLLLEHLTPAQRETYEKNKWFVVKGGRSGIRYRVNTGHLVGNIDVLLPDDRISHRLCGHIAGSARVPLNDHLLAQKLMLEASEDEFLRLANRHGV